MTLARVLKLSGLVVTGLFALFITLFVAFEGFADETATAQSRWLIAAWFVPMVALSVLAWLRPRIATVVLAILVIATIAVSIWFAADTAAWCVDCEATGMSGPPTTLADFKDAADAALVVPIGILGWKRSAPAGVLLLLVGVVPAILSNASDFAVPAIIAGVLYLFAALVARRGTRRSQPLETGPPMKVS